jgi:hypothetical protein
LGAKGLGCLLRNLVMTKFVGDFGQITIQLVK